MNSPRFIATIVIFTFAFVVNGQDKLQATNNEIIRLSPRAFPGLPKNIVLFLEWRSCTIPQSFGDSKPHNVIRGQFAKVGQFDWAVLCSHNQRSSILIFWNSSVGSVAEIGSLADSNFLQTIDGNGNAGFSRAISVVGRDYILEHQREFGRGQIPKIEHQGVNDAFLEKASAVHYFYRNRWSVLQGAD